MDFHICTDTFPCYEDWGIPFQLTAAVIELLTAASGVTEAASIVILNHE